MVLCASVHVSMLVCCVHWSVSSAERCGCSVLAYEAVWVLLVEVDVVPLLLWVL